MNEAADAVSNVPAILLLWLWWVLLSLIDMSTTPPDAEEARRLPGVAAAGETGDPRLAALREADPGFDPDAFLTGARKAYEAVVQAYARADMAALRPLLSGEVLAAFEQACAARAERGRVLHLTFIGIDRAEMEDVSVTAGAMEITVRFRAQMVYAERAADGTTVDGDPSSVTETAESWTFARAIPVTGAAWTVVATDV